MIHMRHLFIFFSLWMASVELLAADKDNMFVVCERQREVRWIRVFSSNDGKCKTVYSKEGYSQVVSSATFYSSCESVLNNVKKNVEGGGFNCHEAVRANVIEIN